MSNDAKTTTLPNKIHHIWLGKPVKQEQLANIMEIARQNPHYQSTIYTDNVEQMNLSIAELSIKNLREITKIAKQNPEYIKSSKLIQTMKEAKKEQIIAIKNFKPKYKYPSDKKIKFVSRSIQREHKTIKDNLKEIDLIIKNELKKMDSIIQKFVIEHSKQEPQNFKVESIDKIWQDAEKNEFLKTKVKARINNKPFEKSAAAKEKIEEQEKLNKKAFETSEGVKLITTLKTEIDRLQPKHDKDIANYAQMSDILRLVTLYLYGGIYADMDSKLSEGKTLPKNYEMPVDQIFVDDEPEYPDKPKSNAIIVAQKASKKLETILQNVTTAYNQSTAKKQKVVSYHGDNPKENFQHNSAKALQGMISNIPKDLKNGFVTIKNDNYGELGCRTDVFMAQNKSGFVYLKKEIYDELFKDSEINGVPFKPSDKFGSKTYVKQNENGFIDDNREYVELELYVANDLYFSLTSDNEKEKFYNGFVKFIDIRKVNQQILSEGYESELYDNHYSKRRHYNTCEFTGPELVNIAVKTELLDTTIFPIKAIHKQAEGVIDWRNTGDIKKLKTRDDDWLGKIGKKKIQKHLNKPFECPF